MIGAGLQGKQLGIVGGGRIGKAVAARARAFGMNVAVSQPSRPGLAGRGVHAVRQAAVDLGYRVAAGAADDRTRGISSSKPALMRMKRTAFLVNTTRGPVVDEEALVWALNEHLLAGAALDVFEREPEVHPRTAGARERRALTASRQRRDGNTHRHGRSRGGERARRACRQADHAD